MKPMRQVYTVSAPNADLPTITLNVDSVQMQLNINATLVGTGTYKLQGNLGMVNTDLNDARITNGLGTTVPDPNGWFDIVPAQTASKQTGTEDLLPFIPMFYIRPVVTATTGAITLTLNVLQQAVR